MPTTACIVLFVQALLTGVGVAMGLWSGMPGLASLGVGLVGVGAITAALPQLTGQKRIGLAALAAAWIGTLLILGSVLFARSARGTVGTYFQGFYLVLAWMNAALALPASRSRSRPELNSRWRLLAVVWAMLGAAAWVGGAYLANHPAAFFMGLLLAAALLVGCHFWFRLRAVGIVAVNTLLLLIIGLPVLDLWVRSDEPLLPHPDPGKAYYLYSMAKKDPAAFGRWWNYYQGRWRRLER